MRVSYSEYLARRNDNSTDSSGESVQWSFEREDTSEVVTGAERIAVLRCIRNINYRWFRYPRCNSLLHRLALSSLEQTRRTPVEKCNQVHHRSFIPRQHKMKRHSVICKYNDRSVLEMIASEHKAQNVWYLVSPDRIRKEYRSVSNDFSNVVSLKIRVRVLDRWFFGTKFLTWLHSRRSPWCPLVYLKSFNDAGWRSNALFRHLRGHQG